MFAATEATATLSVTVADTSTVLPEAAEGGVAATFVIAGGLVSGGAVIVNEPVPEAQFPLVSEAHTTNGYVPTSVHVCEYAYRLPVGVIVRFRWDPSGRVMFADTEATPTLSVTLAETSTVLPDGAEGGVAATFVIAGGVTSAAAPVVKVHAYGAMPFPGSETSMLPTLAEYIVLAAKFTCPTVNVRLLLLQVNVSPPGSGF